MIGGQALLMASSTGSNGVELRNFGLDEIGGKLGYGVERGALAV